MNRAPGGGGEQAEILPPELERAVLLHQRVPVGGEHSQQQRRLRGGAAGERGRAEPGLRQLLPPGRSPTGSGVRSCSTIVTTFGASLAVIHW